MFYSFAMNNKTIIRRVVEAAGGTPKLAERLGIKVQAIYQWTQIPHLRVVELEQITGIPRRELRPDLYSEPDEAA